MSQRKFLFDSDSLIVAKNSYYSPEFSALFWDWVISANQNGVLFTIDKVADEFLQGNEDDYLRNFIEKHGGNLALPTTGHDCITSYGKVQVWASTVWTQGKDIKKTPKALEVFAKEKIADPWLVAYASLHGFEIITNETPAPVSPTKVKIPDAANAFGVKVVSLHQVLGIYAGQNFTFKT